MSETMNIFEQASRLKLRFSTDRGDIDTEQVWGLPLSSTVGKLNLDDLARGLHQSLSTQTMSFVGASVVSKEAELNTLRLEIVKHIIAVRMAENQAKLVQAAKADRKAKIMEIIARKQDAALEGKSLDELLAELDTL